MPSTIAVGCGGIIHCIGGNDMNCDYCKVTIKGSYYQSIDDENIKVCYECGSEMIASTNYDSYYFDPQSTDRGEPKTYYTFIEKEEEQ